MSLTRAQRFLEALQKKAYDGVDMDELAELEVQLAEQIYDELVSNGYAVPTKDETARFLSRDRSDVFRRPIDKIMVPLVVESLERGARRNGMSLPSVRPVFGTLPSGDLNAMTIKVPGENQFVVVIDSGLLGFCYHIARSVTPLVADMIFPDGRRSRRKTISRRIDSNREHVKLFSDTMLSYALFGGSKPQKVMDRQYLTPMLLLTWGMERFIIGHEYGHALRGDVNTATTNIQVLVDELVESLGYSWTQEFLSDGSGFLLSLASAVTFGNLGDLDKRKQSYWHIMYTFAGAQLFFTAVDAMDRTVSLLQTGKERLVQIGSHPPAYTRKGMLRDMLLSLAGKDSAGLVIRFTESMEMAFGQLWERALPVIFQARADGLRPARIWRQVSMK